MQYVKPVKQKNDEFFTYNTLQWNVSAAIRYIKENIDQVQQSEFEVSRMEYKIREIQINPEHAENSDLTNPIIIVKLSPFEEYIVIDGHHRLYKAMESGVTALPCYILDFEQQLQFVSTKQIFNYLIRRVEEVRPLFQKAV